MKTINFNVQIGEFVHESGTSIFSPLLLPESIRIGISSQRMVRQFSNAIEKELLQKGIYRPLLKYLSQNEATHEEIMVDLEAAKNGRYPALELRFDLFYMKADRGQYIGFVPVLSLMASGVDLEALRHNMIENIRLEFIRKKRLNSVPDLISTQWYEEVSLKTYPKSLPFYTLLELDDIRKLKEEAILPQVARKLDFNDDALFGLESEFARLCTAMQSTYRNSVMLIGDSGKGKTTLIQAFCQKRFELGLGEINVWEATAGQLLHRMTGGGGWESGLGVLCQELRKSGDILYIPDFSELFEVGQYAGNSMSMADYLRDYLARGEITILTESTPASAARMELRSPGYLSLFTRIDIAEMPAEELLKIVAQKAEYLADQHKCSLEPEAIQETLRLQQWFTPYSGLPGKTIHFLDALISEKKETRGVPVTKPDVYRRFSQDTGMPEFIINPDSPMDLEQMEAFFRKNIFGQGEAIGTLMDVILSIKAAVIRRGKPLASLLFAGPTGVGKTEMAKVLAQYLFGNRNRMIRFDMSEYRDLSSLMRLTGDASYGEGLLTSAVRQNPFSVILFDELEKVHPVFYDMLLQIIGEGRLTSARGRVADFCSTIIIMTSNIGARDFQTGTLGFAESTDSRADATSHFFSAVQKHFRPELFNRLDRVIAFAPLGKKIVRKIVDREIFLIQNWEGIKGRNVSLEIDPKAMDYLGEKGYNPLYGARFLQRTLQEELVTPLARMLNQYDFKTSLEIFIGWPGKKISFRIIKNKEGEIWEREIGGNEAGSRNENENKNEKTSVREFTDRVTKFRREILQVINGSLYTQMESKYDEMERTLRKLKKRKKESEFWKNEKQQKVYYMLKELQKSFHTVSTDIQEIELENLLLINGLEAESGQSVDRFQQWLEAYEGLTQDLIRLMHPDYDTCTLAIYGNEEALFDLEQLYYSFMKGKDFRVKAFTVWHDKEEARTIEAEIREATKNDLKNELAKAMAKSPYKREPFDRNTRNTKHIPCGMEIEIKGELAFMYVANEGGWNSWTTRENNVLKYFIHCEQVPLDLFKTPEGIHRSEFFKDKKVTRTYHAKTGMKDTVLKVHSLGGNFTVPIHNILNQRYEAFRE